jgi:hypothetical protein
MNKSNKPAFPVTQPATGALPETQIYRDAAGEAVGQKPTHVSAITPSFDLTSPAACALSSADKKLLSNLDKRRAAYARLEASLVVPKRDSIATLQATKSKPAKGRFSTV